MKNLRTQMQYYGTLYRSFFELCAAEALSFRTHFVLLIVVDLIFYGTMFGTAEVLYHHVEEIGPWNRSQFLFFVAFFLTVDQLHMTLFAMSFWEFSSDLRLGKLDFWLVKPAHILFIVFFRHIRVASLLLAPLVWGALIFSGIQVGLSPLSWCMLPLLVLLSLALLITMEILLSAAMFWTVENDGINFLRMQVQSVGRWPDFIYQYLFQKLFSVFIPILLVTSAPVHYLLQTRGEEVLFFLLAALLGMLFLVSKVWRYALLRYESASS
ncbi:ABC-2 family transporter protein [bacterium]|nr:ABC-2 family transporter protein [bacterium]